MENFKEKATKIIEGYCQGIAHLEFDVEDLPKMVQELENLALSITDVVDACDHDFVGQEVYNEMSEPIGRQCAKCGAWDNEWAD